MPIVDELLHGLSNLSMSSLQVTPDILVLQFTIVNACIVEDKETHHWVMVDTGLANSKDFIIEKSEQKFGKNSKPMAIILTHGHFDHVGCVMELADYWDVPVYAHTMEMPYITGKKDYPEGDPDVDEGLVAKLSQYFPHHSIDLGFRAVKLPDDGTIPGMGGWRFIHTPGHTPGHISLFKDDSRTLIAGDAFTTTKQESLMSVITQKGQIKGPPAYLTTDWKAAEKSIQTLQGLNPLMVIPSHGLPMEGRELEDHMSMLVQHFDQIAVPEHGRFVDKS